MNFDSTALPVFHRLVSGIERTLGPRLRGLYLYGSSVLGDFNPDRSDIDLLAVTDGLVQVGSSGLLAFHDALQRAYPAWADRIEVGYFPTETLRNYKSIRGDVVRISPGEPLHRTPALPHWLTDLYAVQQHGRHLLGEPKEQHLPVISVEEFRATIQQMVADWTEEVVGVEEERHQAYVRLVMCRSIFAYANGEQASKVQAAQWVTQRFPQWKGEVDDALLWRASDSPAVNLESAERTIEMVRFVFGATRE